MELLIDSVLRDPQLFVTILAAAVALAALCLVLALGAAALHRRTASERDRMAAALAETEATYGPARSLDAKLAEIRDAIRKTQGEAAAEEARLAELRRSYGEKRGLYDRLLAEVAMLEHQADMAEIGIHEPVFGYETSARFAEALKDNRERQKAMVQAGEATACPTTWTVDGSRAKGEAMVKRATRLALRAFNNECEVIIGKVKWNNASRLGPVSL